MIRSKRKCAAQFQKRFLKAFDIQFEDIILFPQYISIFITLSDKNTICFVLLQLFLLERDSLLKAVLTAFGS